MPCGAVAARARHVDRRVDGVGREVERELDRRLLGGAAGVAAAGARRASASAARTTRASAARVTARVWRRRLRATMLSTRSARHCAGVAARRALGADRPRRRRVDGRRGRRPRPGAAPASTRRREERRPLRARPRRDQLRLGLVRPCARRRRAATDALTAGSPSTRARAAARGRRRSCARWTPREVARVLGQDPAHELIGLYAEALAQLGSWLGDRGALEAIAEAGGSAGRFAASLAAGMPFFDDPGFYKRAQITANDLVLAGVAEFADVDRLTVFADNLAAARAAPRRRAALRAELAARDRRRASCCPPAARWSASCAPAPSTRARRSPPRLGVAAAHARQLALEPRAGAALPRAAAAPHAHRLLLIPMRGRPATDVLAAGLAGAVLSGAPSTVWTLAERRRSAGGSQGGGSAAAPARAPAPAC